MFGTVLVLLFAFFLTSSCSFRQLPEEQCEVLARTAEGAVCGRVRLAEGAHKYASFRGIPYGKPPVGERRFQPLAPVDPWDYILDATEDSPACPQKDLIYGRMVQQARGQSEDCIYLNIHVPYEDFLKAPFGNDTEGLPILVMIHGGGFQVGSGLTDVHGPEYLMTQKLIVVTMNYRLNVFGFLSLGTARVPGNQGLRDILSALRWVQRNARGFGGDPDNVILMGQSCGATAAHLLSLSKAGDGLFHRIFLMSGHAIPFYFDTSPKFAEQISTDFVSGLGINSSDPDVIHDALIKMPLEDIMYMNSIIQYDYGLTSFVPVEEKAFDGVERVLDGDILELTVRGRGSQYPMLLGYTNSEVEFFRWLSHTLQMPQRIQKNPRLILPIRLGYSYPDQIDKLANETAEMCFHGDYSLDNFVNCYSYMFFKYPILKLAQWRGFGGAPGYLYRYSYESQRSLLKESLWLSYKGAAHVEDLTYIFRTNSLLGEQVSFPPSNDDDRMKAWWVGIVSNFTRCSNPTCSSDEAGWPPVSTGELQYQDIAAPRQYSMKTLDADEADWLRFFDKVDLQVRKVTEHMRLNI